MLPLTNCSFNKNGDRYVKIYIDLLLEVMTERVKYGTQNLEICCIHWRAIKMQSIQWLLMFHLGKILIIHRDKIVTGSFDTTAKLWDT